MRAEQLDDAENPVLNVEMSNDGAHALAVKTVTKDGALVRTLDKKGKIVRRELHNGEQVTPLPIDQEVFTLAISLLSLPAHAELPKFTDLGPKRIYDYW
jgi:hypothetical protein